jgi:predicted AAA+ superfamily ATPase
MIKRTLEKILRQELQSTPKSILLLGPRQTGKSTLLKMLGTSLYIDFSDEATFQNHLKDPSLLRAVIAPLADGASIVIDEVQRLPAVLNTVQSIIDRPIDKSKRHRFLLTGSSARKLRRGNANLLPGRVFLHSMFPLTYWELNPQSPESSVGWNLEIALTKGTLPEVYRHDYGAELLSNYINTYLKEEIQAEALTRNLSSYARFLDLAAENSGHVINYSSMASDSEIPKETIRRFYDVLCDTLLAHRITGYKDIKNKRKATQKDMFIFFDLGVRNAVLRQHRNTFSATELGKLFEQWFITQVIAFNSYHKKEWLLHFYRDDSKNEVDLIIDTSRAIVAIEIKYSTSFKADFIKGLNAFAEVCRKPIRQILVYRGSDHQQRDKTDVVPYQQFLEKTIFEL